MNLSSVEEIKVKFDQVKVVAVTCLGITSPFLSGKKFDVCIIDEAGQTTLPVCTISSLCILISILKFMISVNDESFCLIMIHVQLYYI